MRFSIHIFLILLKRTVDVKFKQKHLLLYLEHYAVHESHLI